MNELAKTTLFCVAAFILALAALLVDPGSATPDIFTDQGEFFYPNFKDAQAPKVIEVIDYDEATATARPLKVEFKDNKWGIPSHYNYPADAEQRLARTAAALMELRKDAIVSDRVEDQAQYGVIDPLDQTAVGLTGRGKRVTLRDASDKVLADFIVGKTVDGKPGYRYLRVPNQRRTYMVKTDADISARFEDWIETDLLKLAADDIRKVTINRYSINEMMGTLENVEHVVLTRKSGKWAMSGGGTPRDHPVRELTEALDNLRIVDVRPKPESMARDLISTGSFRLSPETILSLRQRGFFITPMGQLLSNEGEIGMETTNGLQYTLRFGEVASNGAGAPAGAETGDKEGEGQEDSPGQQERRYVFIRVSYSEALARQYAAEEGKQPDTLGRDLARELQNRFAGWYYVISVADFNKLRPSRRDLTRG